MRIHQTKHDLELLSTSMDQKQQAFFTFPNGETPTPTCLLKNCDELGLELDQKVDIFALSFKNANTSPGTLNSDSNANDTSLSNLNTPTPQFLSQNYLYRQHSMHPKSSQIAISPLVQSKTLKAFEARSNDPRKTVIYQSLNQQKINVKQSPIKKRVVANLKTNATDLDIVAEVKSSIPMSTNDGNTPASRSFATPMLAPPTLVPPTLAPPTLAPPSLAQPNLDPPTLTKLTPGQKILAKPSLPIRSATKSSFVIPPTIVVAPPTIVVAPPTIVVAPPPMQSPPTQKSSLTADSPSKAIVSVNTSHHLTTLTPPSNEDKLMVQVMLEMGNGTKFPMNIPAANFGISATSLPPLASKTDEIRTVALPHPPPSGSLKNNAPSSEDTPTIVISQPCEDHNIEAFTCPSAKQQLKAALRKQLGNSLTQELKRPAEGEICELANSDINSSKHFKLEDDEDEERRSKFLERNRAAAARCRKKKKQWIKVLQQKSGDALEINKKLMTETIILRNEVAKLKMLLLEHKDCPVTKARLRRPVPTTPPPTAAVSAPDYDDSELTFTTLTSRESAAQLLASMDTSQLLSPASYYDGSDTTDGSDTIVIK